MANVIPSGEESRLVRRLTQLEAETGVQIRVLTALNDVSVERARSFWTLGNRSILITVNPQSGNVLDFRVGNDVSEKIKRSFWLELQGRYGNMFYVKEHGEDGALQAALGPIETCVRRDAICRQVPGFSPEQYALSAVMASAGGSIAGSVRTAYITTDSQHGRCLPRLA
mmetsp:Transcript_16831/g.36543  ORF Transcript_16831/g.36543 Transcript_16831/m.36543 type:complete len:169 (+) Transcript_16831:285-791(+)